MMRALNWLIVGFLLVATMFIGFFWLGSKDQYDQMMQAGVLRVFLERAGSISLLGLGVALLWWLLNWMLLKTMVFKSINLQALAILLSVAVVLGAICGTAIFCWH
jgi:hypothetical protein